MSELRCWWNESSVACLKSDWPACGYNWLINGPVSLFAIVWFLLGLFMLHRDGSIATAFRFSAARIHDPLAQGIAVAMAQRKYGALQQPRLLRYVKLCAMWAEWPTFTMTPLTVAYKVAGTSGYLEEISLTFSSIIEGVELSLAIVCGSIILLLHQCKKDSIQGDTILRRFAYPITFDALYIPLVSNFVRLGTCPQGVQHIPFPDGSTCDCINRFGIFWVVGLLGFLGLYSSSLYYKIADGNYNGFSLRNKFSNYYVNPILSILAVGLQLEDKKTDAIPITLSFLVCVSFLLQYAYRTQPCIGSGRIPNNIRVLSFSSSLYTTICVLIFLLTTASLDQLYYMLTPLPLVWLASWKTNDRRALLFYIPDLPILDLLQQRATRAKTVGAIAALYMDASKVRHADHEGIIFQLHDIAKHSMNGLPLCRIYVIRTLWFCYIRNFRKGKSFVGEPNEKIIISNELWFKDKDNPDRVRWTEAKLSMRRTPIESALAAARRRVKITRIENIIDVQATEMLAMSKKHGIKTSRHLATRILGKAKKLTSKAEPRRRTIVPLDSHRHLDRFNYHMVSIRDKHWICKNEEPEAAILHHEELHHFALEVLSQCCAMDDRFAMFEIASLLLQWYRSQYLRLNKTVYAHVLSTLCATDNMKCVIDATHTIYLLSQDQVIPLDLWLNNTSFLNNFVLALGHPSKHTVYQCARVLLSVIELASKDEKTNLFVLLTPESITKIHSAFRTWYDSYKISQTIEDCCIILHLMEVHHQRKLLRNLVKKGSAAMLDTSTTKPQILQADKLASMTSTYNRSYWLSLSTNTTMLPLDATSPQVLISRPVSSSRKSAINYGDPNTTCIPAFKAGVGVVTKIASKQVLSTTREIASPTASSIPSINSMILPAAQATKEVMEQISYVPPHKTSELSTLSRIRRASIDLVSFKRAIAKSPKSKAEQFVFVTSAMITEIGRRQALRKRFEQELQRTYYQFEAYLMKPVLEGPAWLMDNPKPKESSRSTMTFGRRAQNNDVVDGFEVVMEIYTTAEECALHDFIETQLDRDLLSFFENHIKPFMTNGVESGRSRKEDWEDCGYKWLTYLPIALLCLFWLIYGIYMLHKESRGLLFMQFDVSRIHDPLAQGTIIHVCSDVFLLSKGIAIALSQRKESTKRRSRLQHNMKLCAMWAEWPSLTYAPVSIAFKVANSSDFSRTLFFSFNFLNEPFNIGVVLMCGIIIALLNLWKTSSSIFSSDNKLKMITIDERLLRGAAYPIAFDVLYIPIASTCLRLAVCPTGYEHVALPGGATCDCIDRYGFFWVSEACGLLGFILIYSRALHYKMYIEPTNTTLDFRFQTSFQVVMVMARTLNPLLSMLSNSFDLSGKPMNAVPIMICYLFSIAFLLCYAYKTQPCIGSGRLPNNIRVITFSSSLYSSICVLLSLISDFSLDQLYISLLPLPLVWAAAWHFNTKRASSFHIPSLSILELLRERSIQAKTVGVIAVLHADPVNIRQVDHELIIDCIEKLVTMARTTELHCRIYSLRILWFNHIENFRKAKICVGAACEESCLSFKNWCKDRLNPERIAYGKNNLLRLRTSHQKLVKVCRVENIVEINPSEVISGIQGEPSFATATFKRILSGLPLSTRHFIRNLHTPSDPFTSMSPLKFHIVKVKHKNWIAKEESPEAAVANFQSIYLMGVEVLNASCALDDRSIMQESAIFLLQWYRARYLRLSPAIFLHILVVLCASSNFKYVIDAVHTTHKLIVEGTLPLVLWQQNPSFLNLFALALDHSSPDTIFKCTKVLATVLEYAEDATSINLYTLVDPSTIGRIHTTFYKWSSHYGISESVERLCLSIYCIQLRIQKKPSALKKPTLTKQKTKAAIVANWAHHVGTQINATLVTVVASSAASVHSVGASLSRRVSHRQNLATNQKITSIQNLRAIDNSHGSSVIHPIHAEVLHSRLSSNKRIATPSEPSVPEILTSKLLLSQFLTSTTKPSLKRNGSGRDLSVTKLRFRKDGKQGPVDRFTFITPDIIGEIQRRSVLRKQFSDLLTIVSTKYTLAATQRHGDHHYAMSIEFMQSFTQLLELYLEAEECAMQHYAAIAIDEKQRNFIELHIKPFMKTQQKKSSFGHSFLTKS
ncbi:hypothetical protein THRCLA_07101 [Thraustotheca clavata]|uniref:Uncharacterized protein n=1 Tax=Thraustotheca clavata TaxID=74557 RepID=A0A1V9ZGU6_9STRA|nr:hypothetical protein THRCLA_07101 [Thraustotheca clavata]